MTPSLFDTKSAWIAISQVEIDAIRHIIDLAHGCVKRTEDSAAITVSGMFLQAAKDAYNSEADTPSKKYGDYSIWACMSSEPDCKWAGYLKNAKHYKHRPQDVICPHCGVICEMVDEEWAFELVTTYDSYRNLQEEISQLKSQVRMEHDQFIDADLSHKLLLSDFKRVYDELQEANKFIDGMSNRDDWIV